MTIDDALSMEAANDQLYVPMRYRRSRERQTKPVTQRKGDKRHKRAKWYIDSHDNDHKPQQPTGGEHDGL